MRYSTYIGWRRACQAAVPGHKVIFEGSQARASAYIEYRGFSETHRIDVGEWTAKPGVVNIPPLLPLPPRIERLARKIFTTDKAITDWCNFPAPALDGRKPDEKLKTAAGVREVESLLNDMAYGDAM